MTWIMRIQHPIEIIGQGINWGVSSLTGAVTGRQCVAWASHYRSDWVPFFTPSSHSDWLFGLEYNSLSVSHTHWHKRRAHRQQNPFVITGKAHLTAPPPHPRAAHCQRLYPSLNPENKTLLFFFFFARRDPEQIIRPLMCSAATDGNGSVAPIRRIYTYADW